MRKLAELQTALDMARAISGNRYSATYRVVDEQDAWATVNRLFVELEDVIKILERDAGNWRMLIGEEQR